MPVVAAFILLTLIAILQQVRIWWLESDNESIMGAVAEMRSELAEIHPRVS